MPRTRLECKGCEYFVATYGLDDKVHFSCYRPDDEYGAVVEDIEDIDACPLGRDKNKEQQNLFESEEKKQAWLKLLSSLLTQ